MIQIRVSKEFAKYLNKVFKEKGVKAYAEVKTCDERHYRFFVSCDLCAALDNGDCDEWGDEYNYIQVSYPESDYACPHNTTTQELKERLCYRSPITGRIETCASEEELKNQIVSLFNI